MKIVVTAKRGGRCLHWSSSSNLANAGTADSTLCGRTELSWKSHLHPS